MNQGSFSRFYLSQLEFIDKYQHSYVFVRVFYPNFWKVLQNILPVFFDVFPTPHLQPSSNIFFQNTCDRIIPPEETTQIKIETFLANLSMKINTLQVDFRKTGLKS